MERNARIVKLTIRHFAPANRKRAAIPAMLALMETAFLLWQGCSPAPEKITAGKFPEELVYVRSKDDIVNPAPLFPPPHYSAKPYAILFTPARRSILPHPPH